MHQRTLNLEMVVADGFPPFAGRVFGRDVHPAEEGDVAVDNQVFPVVTEIYLKLTLKRVGLRPATNHHVRDFTIVAEKPTQIGMGGAKTVIHKTNLDPLPGLGFQRLQEFPPDLVPTENKALQVDMTFCCANGLQHQGVGIVSTLQGNHVVAVQ